MSRYSIEQKKTKFRELAASRTNTVIEKIRILSNCANSQLYDYTEKDVEKITSAIEKQLDILKVRFKKRTRDKFSFD